MNNAFNRLSAIGFAPVITNIPDTEACECLTNALVKGGIPVMEITFRMENAEKYIAQVREKHPEVTVGAGTVLTMKQAELAVEAGAEFLVAPGLDEDIVRYAQANNVTMLPGVSSASEITKAMNLGLNAVKFYPAEDMGGAAIIKSLSAPFKGMQFMPSGGLSLEKLPAYFALPCIAACSGTFMLGKHVEKGEWDEITALCRKSVQAMLGLKLAHVGINASDADEAMGIASALGSLLLLDQGNNGKSSVFVSNAAEVMKGNGAGKNGHLGFSTINIQRAAAYFRAIGTEFDEKSLKLDANGKMKAIYFKKEIGGFAIHLVQA